jgi:hypothetical protein
MPATAVANASESATGRVNLRGHRAVFGVMAVIISRDSLSVLAASRQPFEGTFRAAAQFRHFRG